MKKKICGRAFVLGKNIDTDQIIPAEHLVYSLSDPEESKNYGKFALSGVPEKDSGLPKGNIPFVEDGQYRSKFNIIIGGSNFGCGSSREHATACMKIAGVEAVVAESYARIFYRNAIDGGFFIPLEAKHKLTEEIQTGDEITIDLENYTLTNETQNKTYSLNSLGDVIDIIEAGNIFEYAKKAGLIPS
ncbi:MAG: 3-isopropylmalate dehydratase [Nitrospinae bacterium]|nr:3-isopropylmalate dehydratase [Nitrospinota bacterium]